MNSFLWHLAFQFYPSQQFNIPTYTGYLQLLKNTFLVFLTLLELFFLPKMILPPISACQRTSHLTSMWPWTNHETSLKLSFFICGRRLSNCNGEDGLGNVAAVNKSQISGAEKDKSVFLICAVCPAGVSEGFCFSQLLTDPGWLRGERKEASNLT